MNYESSILEFLKGDLLAGAGVDVDTPLFSSKLLDSLALVDLIAWIETQFSIRIAFADVTLENFDSVRLATKYLEARSKSAT